MAERPSIHHQRRWYYALWCALLAGSLVLLALWERPVNPGQATLALDLQVTQAPPGSRYRLWSGPLDRWPGALPDLSAAGPGQPLPPDGRILAKRTLSVAYRRWVKDILPRRTDDYLVVQVVTPGGEARYFGYPMRQDWRGRLLRPGRTLGLHLTTPWDGLWTDPRQLPRTEPAG